MRASHGSPCSFMRYVYGVVVLQFVVLGKFFFRLPRPTSYSTQGYIRHHGREYTRPSPPTVAPIAVVPLPPTSPTTRVAILMAYTGKHLPPWFQAFATSCRASSSLADWLIFHDGVSVPYGLELPPNVELIDLGPKGLAERLASIIPEEKEEEDDEGEDDKKGKGKGKGKQKGRGKEKRRHRREELRKALPRALRKTPYMLIQFKPALGYIFRDYLERYSHWAFADLDVIMGDLRRLVTPAELEHHDVITFSFGDQFRTYTRGQLTILQKSDWSLEAFRYCPYLQPDNVLRVLTAANPRDASTEGCFSYLLSKSSDLRVLYLPSLFSDANLPEDDYRHDGPSQPPADAGFYEVLVLYDGRVVRCSQKNQLLEDCLAITLTLPAPPAPQAATQLTAPLSVQGFHEVSVRKPSASSPCMWWVAREFQLCMAGTGPQDVLLRENGSFYARPFEKIAEAGGESGKEKEGGRNGSEPEDGAHNGERVLGHWLAGTVEAVMMHFQEWKKDYPYWGVPSCPSPSFAGTLVTDVGFLPVPWPPSLASSDPATLTQALSHRGQASSVGRYCVSFAPTKRGQDAPNHLPLPPCTTWAYRAQPILSSPAPELFTQPHPPAPSPPSPLTLLLLSRGPHDVPALEASAVLWPGPKVVVALLDPSASLPAAYDPLLTQPHLTVVPFSAPRSPSMSVPLKAMTNAGLDAIAHRYVLVLDPARHTLSPSTYPRLLTAVHTLADQRGVAILLPELSNEDITNGATTPAPPFSNVTCTQGAPLPASLLSHYHRVTLSPLDPDTPSSIHDLLLPANERKQHLRLPDLLPQLGNSPNGRALKARPAPPFLLDLLSPHGPLYLRHLEELGGSGCFDSLYLHSLLRMLDYHAYVMPGAHVLPVPPPTAPEPCGCPIGDLTSTLRLWVRRLARQHNLNRAVASISFHQHDDRQQPHAWTDTDAQEA